QRYIVIILPVNTFDIDYRLHRLLRKLKAGNYHVNELTHSLTYFFPQSPTTKFLLSPLGFWRNFMVQR
ncbi:hypothetical protein IMS11_005448, partial [Escherichia coli]